MAHSLAKNLARRCRVIVCGVGGRMGTIRTDLVYANPRFELCGVCDMNLQAAEQVADIYSVRYRSHKEEIRTH
jgi:predicted dehydrogenase